MTPRPKLSVLTGAPGSGKTTLLPHLVRLGNGLVVMDIDELLEDGALLGVPIATDDAVADWPAYNRLWLRIIDLARRSGHPVLFCSPLVPHEFPEADAWALLDCADDTRRARLTARGWNDRRIEDALNDAAYDRTVVQTAFRSDIEDPASVAARVVAWATD